jgi:hypothetical protein
VLLGLISCWIAVNVLVGAWLALHSRDGRERRRRPRARRLPTTPGPDFRAERLRPDPAPR